MIKTHTTFLIIGLLTIILACGKAFGQIEVGFQAGINSDFVKTNGFKFGVKANQGGSLGYHAGIFGRVHFESRWSVISEIQFIRKGVRAIYPHLPNRQRTNFEYFDIAVLPAYHLTDRWILEAGPSFDIQTRLFYSDSQAFPRSLVQFGLNAGVRLKISDGLSCSLKYYHALTPFETYTSHGETPQGTIGISQYFYRTLQLSLAYTLTKAQ